MKSPLGSTIESMMSFIVAGLRRSGGAALLQALRTTIGELGGTIHSGHETYALLARRNEAYAHAGETHTGWAYA